MGPLAPGVDNDEPHKSVASSRLGSGVWAGSELEAGTFSLGAAQLPSSSQSPCGVHTPEGKQECWTRHLLVLCFLVLQVRVFNKENKPLWTCPAS